MQIDPEVLRQHYSSLSDDALLAVDGSELIDIAQRCYDAELEARGLASPMTSRPDGPGHVRIRASGPSPM